MNGKTVALDYKLKVSFQILIFREFLKINYSNNDVSIFTKFTFTLDILFYNRSSSLCTKISIYSHKIVKISKESRMRR